MPRANRHYIPRLYLRRQCSEVDLDGFNRKMEKLIRDCYKAVKTGGRIALLIQNTTELGEEIERLGRCYADHVFDCYGFFIKAGFTPAQRINVPMSWEEFAGEAKNPS